MFRNQNAPARPAGGAEYGVQQPQQQAYVPPQPHPSSRPLPQGYGQTPIEAVGAQLSGLISSADDFAAAPPPPPTNPNEVVLSRAYMAHGELVDKITLRRPTTREIKKCGVPIKVQADGMGRIIDMEMKWDVVAAYIPLLASPPLPASTVDEFDYFDLDACGAVLAPFFVRLAPSGT